MENQLKNNIINWKTLIVYTIVIVVLSVVVTKRFWPTIDTQVKVEEKEIIKHDVRTIIKEQTNPDGSSTKETIIVDNSKEVSAKKFEQTTTKKNDWFVAAGAEATSRSLNPIYRIEVNRRVLGDVYVGVSGRTDGLIGLQIGFSF
jgi:hypothetical protein